MKRSKAPGPDAILVEMLLALDDEGIDILWHLCTEIYETGIFPKQMLLSIFICLPKIQGTLVCQHGLSTIEQVPSFICLGALVISDGRSKPEIRITISKSAFGRLRFLLTDRKLLMPIRIRLLKCYVWPTPFVLLRVLNTHC